MTLLINFFIRAKSTELTVVVLYRNNARGGFEFLNRVIWAYQEWIRFNPHGHPMALLNLADMLTLLVDQEIGNADWRFDQHFFGTGTPPLFFQLTQNGQTQTVL
jgi:hypothetical protein